MTFVYREKQKPTVKQRLIGACIVNWLVFGMPFLGYFTGNETVQNFGVFFLTIWTGLTTLMTVVFCTAAYAIGHITADRDNRDRAYKGMIETDTLGQIHRVMMITLSIMLICIGYVGFGVWFLICTALIMAVREHLKEQYKQFKSKNI